MMVPDFAIIFYTFAYMIIKEHISKNKNNFLLLCRSNGVRYLYAFGSSVTKNFDPHKSDIDLLVEVDSKDPIERGERLLDLWDKFEIFFNRRVDLLTESSIHNSFLKKTIDSTKILIYDGSRQKILI